MSIKDMPHVTVEQVVNLRDKAMQLEKDRDEWKSQAEGEAIVAGSYRDERDALAAHVERLQGSIRAAISSDWSVPAEEALEEALDDKAAASLDRLKAQWQAEALQELYNTWKGEGLMRVGALMDKAIELQEEAEGGET